MKSYIKMKMCSKLFLVLLLYFEPTWSFIDFELHLKKIVTSRESDHSLEKVSYIEGELIYGSCVVYRGDGNLRFKKKDKLIYESKATSLDLLSRDNVASNAVMQIKMLPEYNNSVLECTDKMDTLSVLILLDESIPDNALNVNGFWLTKVPTYLEYIYFMNSINEYLSISVSKKHKINEDSKNQEDSTRQGLADDDITVQIIYPNQDKSMEYILMSNRANIFTHIRTVCGTLCFDPYFVNLDPSKVLAKYISNNNYSVVKYELDFEENEVNIVCTSVSGKGMISVAEVKGESIYHRTSALTLVGASGRFRCDLSEDGGVRTTILDVTRKTKYITTVRKHHRRIQEDKTTKSKVTNLTLPKGCKSIDQNTRGSSEILIAIFVTMISTSVVIITIYTVCLKHRRRLKKLSVEEANPNPANNEPYYETIGNETSNQPYDVDRPQREPYPLPSEECEENKKYLHYDTPYEWRIFRNPFHRVQPRRNGRFSETQN